MSEQRKFQAEHSAAPFKREFFDSNEEFTYIGAGEFGGKASGLAFARDLLAKGVNASDYTDMIINIPRLTVLTTDVFDAFMTRNKLWDAAVSDSPDDRIAHTFQKASFPTEFVGDLMALIRNVHQPLAVRSSSLLEDALHHPFAGVYATKMIPNNQFDMETRFRKLVEAVKFVWASTFFQEAKAYIRSVEQSIESEKMAVIIQ
jgi:phosphoenolpyruvate synthase/pyruvate phosphate dikinase